MIENDHYYSQSQVDILSLNTDEQADLYDVMKGAEKDLSLIITFNKARYGNLDSYLQNRDRIHAFERELLEDYTNISSSLTAGRVFQKLHEELTNDYNVDHQEIVSIYQKLLSEYMKHPEIPSRPQQLDRKLRKQVSLFFENQLPVPPWWKKGTMDWQNFMWQRLHFPNYIHEGLGFSHLNKPNHIIPDCYLHFVDPDQLPDWLEGVVQKDEEQLLKEVNQEFDEDMQVKDKLYADIDNIPQSLKKLYDFFNEKAEGYNDWIIKKTDAMNEIAFRDLKSFMLYMPVLLEAINTELYNIKDPNGLMKAVELLYNRYISYNPLDKDAVALWLAQNFEHLQIGTKDGIKVSTIASVLRNIKDPNALEKIWLPIKSSNKQLYKYLRFSLGPLLELASPEEVEILADYIESLPLSTSLQEMSKNIEAYSQELMNQTFYDANLQKTVKNISNFGKQWIVNNHQTARKRIVNTLKLPGNQSVSKFAYTKTHTEGIEDFPVEQHIFSQWHIFYTTNIDNPTGNSRLEIIGSTAEEITTSLEKFIRSNNISVSVKISSIVNCLEQIINTPQEIEQFVPHLGEHHSEVDYKKRKRGKVRILYTLDPEKKDITFWLYQKKQQSYRLH